MLEVNFYEQVKDELLDFAVIIARTEEKWVFCKHKERDTLEAPGGHREPGEDVLETAKRELREETGAIDFRIQPVCAYSVKGKTKFNGQDEDVSFGMLYVADITSFEEELHSEMESIVLTEELPERWTYPEIQPRLLEEVARRGYWIDKGMESMNGDKNGGCEDAKKEPDKNYVGSWLPVGMMIGVVFGCLTDNVGLGISMGMLWGVGLGGIINSYRERKAEKTKHLDGADKQEETSNRKG